MKTVKRMIIGCMFLSFFGNVLAAAPKKTEVKPTDEDVKLVQQQVRQFLGNQRFQLEGTVDLNVVLYLNQENEIEVLGMSTRDKKLRRFVLKHLSEKSFADKLDRRGQTYICPMRIRGVS